MLLWIDKNIRLVLVSICLLLLTAAAFLQGWVQILFLILAVVTGGCTLYFLLPSRPTKPERKQVSSLKALQKTSQEELLLPSEEGDEASE